MSWKERLSAGLSRSRERFAESMNIILGRGADLGDDFWDELEETLILGDLGASGAIEVVENLRLDLGEKVVGGLSHNRLLADDAVDNRTRRAATAEALEVIAVCDVLVGLVDGLVDFLSGNDDLGDDLVGLGPLGGDGDLQRSSSVSCAAGAAAPRAVSKL